MSIPDIKELPKWLQRAISGPVEICTCGHPMTLHRPGFAGTKCELDRSNCKCNHFTPILLSSKAENFLRPHGTTATGHALTQAAIWGYDTPLNISSSGLATMRCYSNSCKKPTFELMPVLMDTFSRSIVTNPKDGRMTRLWCRECLENAGRDFVPYLSYLFERILRL